MMDRSHWNQKHMKNTNCLQEFVHKRCMFKCSPFARTHAWRRFQHRSIAVSNVNDVLSEIGPYHN